jgi:hypothetical protein
MNVVSDRTIVAITLLTSCWCKVFWRHKLYSVKL